MKFILSIIRHLKFVASHLCLFFLLITLNETNLFAGKLRAKIYFDNPTSKSLIDGFAVKRNDPEVIIVKNKQSQKYEYAVVLEGNYNQPNSELGIMSQLKENPSISIKSTPEQTNRPVSLVVFLSSNVTKIDLTASNSSGSLLQDSIKIQLDSELLPKSVNNESIFSYPLEPRLRILPELGFASQNYSQTNISSFSAVSGTVKLDVDLTMVPRKLYAYANIYGSGFNQFSNYTNYDVRFIWINAGGQYTWNVSSWKIGLSGGWFYGDMIVTNGAFGFSRIMGMSASPFIQKTISTDMNLGVYFKYAPIVVGTGLSNTANALGIFWSKTNSKNKDLKINIDYFFTNIVSGIYVLNLTSLGLSASYSGFSFNF